MSEMSDEAIIGYAAGRLVEALKASQPPYPEEALELESILSTLRNTVAAVTRLLVTRVNAWEEVNKEGVKNL